MSLFGKILSFFSLKKYIKNRKVSESINYEEKVNFKLGKINLLVENNVLKSSLSTKIDSINKQIDKKTSYNNSIQNSSKELINKVNKPIIEINDLFINIDNTSSIIDSLEKRKYDKKDIEILKNSIFNNSLIRKYKQEKEKSDCIEDVEIIKKDIAEEISSSKDISLDSYISNEDDVEILDTKSIEKENCLLDEKDENGKGKEYGKKEDTEDVYLTNEKINFLLEKYNFIVREVHKFISKNAFNEAEIFLKENYISHHLYKASLDSLLKEINEKKRNYFNFIKYKSSLLISEACTNFQAGNYSEALDLLNLALSYDKSKENEILDLIDLVKLSKKEYEDKLEEISRLKREKKLKERYNKSLSESKLFIDDNDFDSAIKIYESLLAKYPNKQSDLLSLINEAKRLSEEYISKHRNFDFRIKEVEDLILYNEFNKALDILNELIQLNINNSLCLRKIEYCHDKIKRDEDLRILKLKREEEIRNKYKDDANQIKEFLQENGIRKFYHFTDSRNLNSIKLNGGLFSWWYCENHNIEIPAPGGDGKSRELDQRHNLENYVRLSFAKNHPMRYIAEKDGRIFNAVLLEVSTEVATYKETLFTDMNAARTIFKQGDDVDFIKNNVKIDVVKEKNQFSELVQRKGKEYYQAEVLVKEQIPIKDITNI